VTVRWDPVPFAASYTLHYTTTGGIPSPSYGEHVDGVVSPFVLSSLQNGGRHVVLLQAHSSEGEDNWSAPVAAIPLSPLTLLPQSRSEWARIVLEWRGIPATDSYQVLRAPVREGPYAVIAPAVSGTRYEDSDVLSGIVYYYKVGPAESDVLLSDASWGCASVLPQSWIEVQGLDPEMTWASV